ncbi:MAG: hypothetical protein EOL88_12575 [Bacteroidia bacterium]|jgi:hypothetical protein|nr:hypothetical protein [Bacteroidales bacterium]MDD2322702.1 hypothetical protein [Bacteroidales bacterium]MDD3011081.1 hypothetical protein [Bacteroidales bacterium]MDD3961717.1 hypothetical protein [Bacteroidales bacterium]NCD42911.1 hypothetical protein [Bacteroidia bacterium]
MKRSIKLAIAFAGILVIMAITKPSEESFNSFLDKKYSIEENSTQNDLEILLNKAIKSGVNVQAQTYKTYSNHTLYAEVITQEILDEERYIGIFGFWIQISR